MKSLLLSTALLAMAAGSAPAQVGAQVGRQPAPSTITTQLPRHTRPVKYTIEIAPDAANLRFSGRTMIDILVVEPTRTITFNAVELGITEVSLAHAEAHPGNRTLVSVLEGVTSLDADKQTATASFNETLQPGRYELTVEYTGKINQQASGLFALDYQSGGAPKRALYTQFEAPDARRMFPSWDEPQFRTPYDLSVMVPAGQTAISNMPERARTPAPGGATRVSFGTTPPMSSYLLFLGMGEFDRISMPTRDGTQVGVVTKRGDSEKGRYALQAQAQLLPYYNDYFGQKYPMPKLDNVAGPGSSQFFGAMENWGAIFSFESILLVDPAITTDSARQRIYEVDAHEMAHQWFGNLVTMAWWDDLWLNEGFASWMASKATDHFHPEWQVLLGRIDGREAAMSLDAVKTTHPVVQKINVVDEINQAFDAITYQKGEAVITMLEDYVGADAWRRGVRDYMATYKYGNTVTDDLWRKVETAAGKPISAIAHDFTLKPGVPLIRVESATCVGGSTRAVLEQGEFSRDNRTKKPLTWRVPVIAGAGAGDARALVANGRAQVTVPGCGALIVNKGQTGYYRTLYAPALFAKVASSYARLAPADQIGLLADNWGLGLAGYQSSAQALDLVDRVPANANTQLVARAAGVLASAYDMHDGDAAGQARVARYAAAKLGPVLARLGMSPRANESSNDAILRAELISTLGGLGDASVTREANRRFAELAVNPKALDGPLRAPIMSVVAYNADAATWDRMRAQARAEQVPLIRDQMYELLASTRDEGLARRALALALTAEPGATNSSAIIGAVAANHPDLAFDFALSNRAKIESFVDAASATRFIPGLASGSVLPATAAKVADYATRYMTPQSRRPADITIGRINDRVRGRREALPAISAWFARKGA